MSKWGSHDNFEAAILSLAEIEAQPQVIGSVFDFSMATNGPEGVTRPLVRGKVPS